MFLFCVDAIADFVDVVIVVVLLARWAIQYDLHVGFYVGTKCTCLLAYMRTAVPTHHPGSVLVNYSGTLSVPRIIHVIAFILPAISSTCSL